MLKKSDNILFFAVLLLCWTGIVAVFGASAEISNAYYGNRFHFLSRQVVWFIFGMLGLFIMTRMSLDTVQSMAKIGLLISLLLLILVYAVGITVKGATRWISLGFFNLQPATLVQFIMIIFTADYLYRRSEQLEDFRRLFPILLITAVFVALIAFQPDFSTAAMLGMTVFLMLFISPVPFKNLSIVVLSGVGLAVPILISESYRINRIISWFSEPLSGNIAANWQSYQSVTSFGLGGLTGVGFGYSRQKFFFLPEAHTDYILAIIGEELGFIGVLLVLVLFLIVIWRGFRIANRATTLFHFYLAAGLTCYIGLYVLINILVVIGALPTTGLPLPFISYGGNQMLINLASIGLLLNISRHSRPSYIQTVDGDG